MYMFKGAIKNREIGPIETSFTDGSVLQFNPGSDGEALVVEPSAWIDHFSEPLSAENREFVKKFGKWTAFDVSREAPYSRPIDEIVEEVTPIRTPEDKIQGVTIKTKGCMVEVYIEADSAHEIDVFLPALSVIRRFVATGSCA